MRSMVALTGLLILAACGGQEFTAPVSSEIPPGPGLFTGDDGALVISSSGVR